MLISNFNKKILLLFHLVILSGNACAEEYLDKLYDKIKFPTLNVLDTNEKPLMLKFNQDLKKKGYVINFWATWCVPCKKELPDLQKMKTDNKNFKIIIVSIDKKSIKDQLSFLKKNKVDDLATYFDKNMLFFKSLKLRGIPTTLLIKDKTIIAKKEGIFIYNKNSLEQINNFFN